MSVLVEMSRGGSATPGMQAFHQLTTVGGQPLVTTYAMFINDDDWKRLGSPQEITVTIMSGIHR